MAPVPLDALVVFGVVGAAMVLFVTERLPPDTTAVAVLVTLAVLEPWTHVDGAEALSGFSSPATITILAMYVLSDGVQSTGIVRRLGVTIARLTHGSTRKLLGAVLAITGPLAGLINNTPVVAVFIPMVTELADREHVSPSKLLIPLSFVSMLGGMLTLVGTATNLLASDLARELTGRGFSMFLFTPIGVVVLIVGAAYLFTVGQWLLPERIAPVDLIEEFALEGHLHRVSVRQGSPLVGSPVSESVAAARVPDPEGGPARALDLDLDVVQIIRGEHSYVTPRSDRDLRAMDVLTLRGTPEEVRAFCEAMDLRRLPSATVTEDELAEPEGVGTLVELGVAADSSLIGETIESARIRSAFDATVLGIRRRGGELVTEDLTAVTLREGTGLLVHTTREGADRLRDSKDVVVTETAHAGFDPSVTPPDAVPDGRAWPAVGILLAVVALAALGWLPIAIAALAGVVVMVATGITTPSDAYAAVSWDVIFLLAGVIPLGIALEQSGAAGVLGSSVAGLGPLIGPLALLGVIFLLTGLLGTVITPVASVALLSPVAVDVAGKVGADPFAFMLGVAFGASTAFASPVGYQTNLMVYGPGGYRFTDFVRVGLPLQAILAVVTPVAIDLVFTV